jgi:hypothetical protein
MARYIIHNKTIAHKSIYSLTGDTQEASNLAKAQPV